MSPMGEFLLTTPLPHPIPFLLCISSAVLIEVSFADYFHCVGVMLDTGLYLYNYFTSPSEWVGGMGSPRGIYLDSPALN